jgi:hypothetical protein
LAFFSLFLLQRKKGAGKQETEGRRRRKKREKKKLILFSTFFLLFLKATLFSNNSTGLELKRGRQNPTILSFLRGERERGFLIPLSLVTQRCELAMGLKKKEKQKKASLFSLIHPFLAIFF